MSPSKPKRTAYGIKHVARKASVALLAFFAAYQFAYATDLGDAGGAGGDPATIMRIEEDWEVVLNEPSSDVDAPQFHTAMSPFPDTSSYYLQVCWNYREQAEFTAGGMQLQAWQGDFAAGKKNYREDKLSTTAETITWTQSMQTTGSVLTLAIDNGSSTTWGSFGGSDTSLSGSVGVSSLNSYDSNTSVENSWITYGANRVDLLRIKEIRYYNGNGVLLSRDTVPKVVYALDQ
jgi:hypothetical protein